MSDEENWYILKVDDVDGKIFALNDIGVPCSVIGSENITFPSSLVTKVLGYLGNDTRAYSLEATNMKNTFVLKFIDDIESSFERPREHFEGWDDMLPVMKGVFEIFGVRIVPTNSHGSARSPSPPSEGLLYVHFWSTPQPTRKIKMQKVICGVPITSNQSDALEPSNVGIAIKDAAGTTIAEYVNDNLYVLFDLPHAEGDSVTELFTNVMRSFFKMMGKNDSDLVNFYQHVRGKLNVSSEDSFINECSKLYVKNFKEMEQTLSNYDSKIDVMSQEVIALKRDREILLMKLEPLKASIDSRKDWAHKEYLTLLASPHVKDVMVTGKTIHVFTDMIPITYDGETYNIGEFKIDIYTDGSNRGVRAFNLTNPKGNVLAHPHVKIDGACCLGNISDAVSKLLAEYNYVILAQLMITFLESYNPGNAYGKVELWKGH